VVLLLPPNADLFASDDDEKEKEEEEVPAELIRKSLIARQVTGFATRPDLRPQAKQCSYHVDVVCLMSCPSTSQAGITPAALSCSPLTDLSPLWLFLALRGVWTVQRR
jgi:hypothetical protein